MTASIEAQGVRIAYERVGAGPPIVFLHGFFGDHRVWRRQFDLADKYTCVAWDAPGCGGSSRPTADFAMSDYSALLAEVIARLDLDRPHLVGNSFGGTLALQVASRHPNLIASVVGLDTYAGWSGSFPPDVVARRLDASLPDLDLPPEQLAEKWLPGFLTAAAPTAMKDEVRAIVTDFDPAGMRVMIRALAEADLREELEVVRAPTLLVWGAEDVRSPLEVARDLERRIEGSQLVVFQGAGHLVQVEAADRVNAELRRFVGAVEG